MRMFNMLILSSAIAMTSQAYSAQEKHCFSEKVTSEKGYSFSKNADKKIDFCIKEKNGFVMLSETSFVFGDNEYLINGLEKTDLNNIESIQNLNGKLVIKTKSKHFYTGDIGYVLHNGEYLPLKRNNAIQVKKESLRNVDKILYSGDLMAFSQDKKVFIKKGHDWEQLALKNVIDVTMTRYGSYLIFTDNGVMTKLQYTDIRSEDKRIRGVYYSFDKANSSVIPFNDLRFDFVENHEASNFKIRMKNIQNPKETYYIYFDVNKALIKRDDLAVTNIDKSLNFCEKLPSTLMTQNNIVKGVDLRIKRNFSDQYGDFDSVVFASNSISTRYNGKVDLKYKEEIQLINLPIDNCQENRLNDIVKVTVNEDNDKAYILKDTGEKTTFDLHSYKVLETTK